MIREGSIVTYDNKVMRTIIQGGIHSGFKNCYAYAPQQKTTKLEKVYVKYLKVIKPEKVVPSNKVQQVDNTVQAIQRAFEKFDNLDSEDDPELYYHQTILLRVLIKLAESYDWKKISA